jgi:hypothetical protein
MTSLNQVIKRVKEELSKSKINLPEKAQLRTLRDLLKDIQLDVKKVIVQEKVQRIRGAVRKK